MATMLSREERARIILNLRKLTRLMDYSMVLPGTNIRFGLDPILGLIPGAGDTASLLISVYIILQARRLGISSSVMTRMVSNVVLDSLVGAIPVLGDIFDFAYKANRRNLKLLKLDPDDFIDVNARPL